eukprot:XP_011665635.1 PREDICTED: uncharacterized protein LOC585547 isoform X4 [Strongylocentrotus purpuratus]
MASDKKKDINGVDNRGYDDQTEIGMKPMSKAPENWRMSKHFVEENSDGVSSSLKKKSHARYKIMISLMVFLVAIIIAMGVALHIFINDDSRDVFETLKTTTMTKMTTPRGGVSIVELGVNITLPDREYTDDLGDKSSSAYMNFTNVVISSIDATYANNSLFNGAAVISVSSGSIKVELMMSFNMPLAETERSNAIELTLDNLKPNMQDALDDNAIVDVITPLCEIEPCTNGGTCNDTLNSSDYSCTCEEGYTGKSCQNIIGECASNPCENGGECNDDGGSYTCTCTSGFMGVNCEQVIGGCASNPCKNGGQCENTEGSYTCTCTSGYTGINCGQDIGHCASNPCENGGECNGDGDSYTCTCTSGFMGVNCETDIDECDNNPCENGGQCDNTEGSYRCICTSGFTGMNCELASDCGFRPAYSSSRPRIIGGSPTQLGDWPWMVSLRDRSNVHRCAAVVINSTTAVTAAHCVKKFDTAVLGDLKLSMTSPYHIETDVEAAIHPDYAINTITNDIAVIKFNINLEFNDYIQPICLQDRDASTRFTACYITGWGHTSEGGTVSDTLQKATITLFDEAQCQSFYPDRTITPTMLCAGHLSGEMDACQGDTGGPLQCEDQYGRFHLVGITSFGYGCGRPNTPGVYTKVSEYYDFISSADPQPEPEPVLAVDLSLDIPFVVTQLRFPGLEFQWILNTADGNAIDIYIFKLDILRVRDTLIIGHGSDPQSLASVIVNSRDGPVSHVYRIFDDYAWIQLYVTPYLQIPLQLGVRGLAEGALVDREDNSDFCANQPCGAGNLCMENSVGYSCNCLVISSGSSCKELSHEFSEGESYSYMEREVQISSGIDCDFDNGWCGWDQERLLDNLDWTLYTGSEHRNFIGPAVDHTELSDSGSYIYIETFGDESNYTATLVSSKFTGTESDHRQCLTFFYYVSRGDDFDLGVQFVAENTTVAEPVWSLPGKILNRWNIAEFELSVAGWFLIEARLAGYSRGPISIDDIQFTDCLLDGNLQEAITLVPGNVVYRTSPNFPNIYPNHVTQLWTITAPEGYGARFDIDVINLEQSFDRLAIGTGHDPTNEGSILDSWNGHHLLQSVTSVSRQYQYWVSFESDLTIRDQGFVIAIYPVQFTETYITMETGETLNITSPNYPMPYPNSQIVLWLITAPPQHGLYFRFAKFETEARRDMVIVGTGESPSPDAGIRLAEMSGFITPSDIVYDDTQAWIMFRADFETIAASGFFVEVRTVERLDCNASNAFHCPNGQCIPLTATCDGYNDCQDFTDEEHCPACVTVPASCSQILPYNLTYFPNQHATSADDADIILEQVVNGCPQGNNLRQLACNMLFPECPHFGPTLQPCKSSCMTELELCTADDGMGFGEEWPLVCDSLPETGEDLFGRCTGPNGDVLNTSICGTRPAYKPYQSRIVGGVNAQEGEFPWMAYLYNTEFGQYCGATLVASEWVVTAAHCIWGISDFLDSVVMGDLHLSIGSEHHLAISPDNIFMHPQYDDNTTNADIALIKLSQPVPFNEYVRPACLSQTLEELKDYKTCIITGWGNTEHDGADNLRKAVVRLIEKERCKELYDIPDDYDTEFLICAGFERGGIDTCQGDSGGPMVCEGSDGRWHLTGITSFGFGCADPGFPGVYARVSTLLPFVETVMQINRFYETVPIVLGLGDTENIYSPNYPLEYDSNTDLTLHAIAPAGYSIVITFITFEVENTYDALIVYQGFTGNPAERIRSNALTGYQLPDPIKTFGSYVWLRFKSDEIIQDGGFFVILSVEESIDCNNDGMINCSNGICISKNATCDGFNDCLDFSDEDYCPPCEDVPPVCKNLVPYSSTYFPNPFADTREDALDKVAGLDSIISCHSDMMELVCNTFFPECIHNGPTRRPCLSGCIDVTDACEQRYQETIGQPWPINCTHFTDSLQDTDGSCLGGQGDYLNTTICGTRPAYTPDQSRVVGGADAKEGEFPWMVYLYSHERGQVCGGTLIGPEWVVTAAHCVVDIPYSVDRIILGDLLLSSPSNHHLNITPAEIIPYPGYYFPNGDLALIRLSQPVDFTAFVRPACLAESSEEVKDYKRCTVSGWGNTEAGFDADVLQKAIVHLITNERCAELYVNRTSDQMICAGYERGGIDTCQGDSGGPLVCEGSDGRWHLVGATSWGDGCADPGKPGIYARVSQFWPFIKEVLTGKIPLNGSCGRSCCTDLSESCNRGDCFCDQECSTRGDCCSDFQDFCEFQSSTSTPSSTERPGIRPAMIVIDFEIGETEEIISPNFPQVYPNNVEMLWYVRAPTNYSVSLRFAEFSTEPNFDFLNVYGGLLPSFGESTRIASLTGDERIDDILYLGSYLWLEFITDSVIGSYGFRLVLSVVNTEEQIRSCYSSGKAILLSSFCDGALDCPDGTDEQNCPPFQLAAGESTNFVSRSIPDYFGPTPLEWTVTSADTDLALVVKVEYISLLVGDSITFRTIGADSGEDYVWTLDGPLNQDYSQAADKVFPSGGLVIEASLNGTRDFDMKVMSVLPQDITGCEGSDRLITPKNTCDGIVDCPDFSDEQDCVPLESIALNLGQVATIETHGYPELLTTSLALRMTWTIRTGSQSRLRMYIQRFVTEASHTLTIGTGLDATDESSIVFKLEMFPFVDRPGAEVGDISPPGNSMWIRIEKPFTSRPAELILFARIEAVTEDSLQCPSNQLSCGGIFPGCYNETNSCDGVNDCFDGADEDCECPGILDVRCGIINTCVHRRNFCDGRVDCGDDESKCTFVCDNGHIVHELFICDGYNDCGDFTDELQDCECASNQFDCGERCISTNDVCNDYVDCANGADEANCTCKSFEFQCDNGECVPYWTLCDGDFDCSDGSEERQDNCRYCPGNYHQCPDFSSCLSPYSICNFNQDCKDGSDELNCPWSDNTTEPVIEPTESTTPTRQTTPLSFIPYEACGLRPALDIHRVTHGEDVTGLGEWPWQIALYRTSGSFTCGGSVITPDWILTAAHCVDEPGSNYTIKAGSLAYFKFEGGGQIRDVAEVIQHPFYDRFTLVNDIAILKLASPLNITNEVQPICLPTMDETIPQPGQYVTFTGWGSYRERNDRLPDFLQEGRMPVIPNNFCDHYAYFLSVRPSMFCTMYHTGLQGVCTGDSGGPIVQEINGRWTLVGISSWVEICGAPYIPNGFTRVSSFIDLVQAAMTAEN